MKKSTITNQWLYSFLLLIMAMVVPRQAYRLLLTPLSSPHSG